MPQYLDTPRVINETVTQKDVRFCTLDFVDNEVHITIIESDSTDAPVGQPRLRSLATPDAAAWVNRVDTLISNGMPARDAMMRACLEAERQLSGETGPIT